MLWPQVDYAALTDVACAARRRSEALQRLDHHCGWHFSLGRAPGTRGAAQQHHCSPRLAKQGQLPIEVPLLNRDFVYQRLAQAGPIAACLDERTERAQLGEEPHVMPCDAMAIERSGSFSSMQEPWPVLPSVGARQNLD